MRISIAAGSFTLVIFLSGCSSSEGIAPHDRRIEATAAAISQLFLDQCVSQIDAEWARAEVNRRIRQCGFFDNGDCKARNEGGVGWQVDAGAGNTIDVNLWWNLRNYREDGDGKIQYDYSMPSHKVNCAIDIPKRLVGLVKPVSGILKNDGYRVIGPIGDGKWIGEKKPYIALVRRSHFSNCAQVDQGAGASPCAKADSSDGEENWSFEYRYY